MPDQRVIPEVRNTEASTSQSAQQARQGKPKVHARRENIHGRRARERVRDLVEGGEQVARPIMPFEVDTHRSWMTEYELVLIQRYYQVPDYVQFRFPGPADVLTRPPPGCVVVYRDYFIKGLRLPLHPFIREVLLNLDVFCS